MLIARAAVVIAVGFVLVSAVARALLSAFPPPLEAFSYSDLVVPVYTQPLLERHWPYFAFPFFYQPLLGWLMAALSYVVPSELFVVFGVNLVVAVASGCVAVLLLRLAGAKRTLLYWSCAPQVLFFSGANVDVLAVLFLLAATTAASAGRLSAGGAALALGAATKVFPLVALPPLALGHGLRSTRGALALAVATALVLVLIDLPAVVAPYSLLDFGVGAYVAQPWNPDSIWLPVVIALDIVFDPSTTDRIVVVGSLVGVAITYVLLVVRPARRGADPARLAWIGVLVLLLWTRLYSVQYAIWLLPLFALYVPRLGLFALMTTGDLLVYVAVFWQVGIGSTGPAVVPLFVAMIIGVIVRHVALVLLLLAATQRPRAAAPAVA